MRLLIKLKAHVIVRIVRHGLLPKQQFFCRDFGSVDVFRHQFVQRSVHIQLALRIQYQRGRRGKRHCYLSRGKAGMYPVQVLFIRIGHAYRRIIERFFAAHAVQRAVYAPLLGDHIQPAAYEKIRLFFFLRRKRGHAYHAACAVAELKFVKQIRYFNVQSQRTHIHGEFVQRFAFAMH